MLARRVRREHIKSVALSVFILLGCAMIVGFCVAKMIGSLPNREETRQIAKWDVAIEGVDNSLELIAGGDGETYKMTVTNNSEVSSTYDIVLTGVPDGVKVGIDGGTLQTPDGGSVTLEVDDGALGIGENRLHTLEFVASIDTEVVGGRDIAVSVRFTQEMPR